MAKMSHVKWWKERKLQMERMVSAGHGRKGVS